jgi:glycogen phosphorylase
MAQPGFGSQPDLFLDASAMVPIFASDAGRRLTRVETLKRAVADHITYTLARDRSEATARDFYMSTSWSLRDRLAERWASTQLGYRTSDTKRVYYLSLEFLMGRTLHNALINLGMEGPMAEALEELGHELDELRELEPDAGLGNGGLGRLAACYLDSMATLQIPGYGYGIRYEHGIFKQKISNGRQVELPDNWLHDENPWEIARPDRSYPIKFYGRVDSIRDDDGRVHFEWVDTQDVLAMAYDTPIPGYRNGTVNTLRLWAAKATEEFDLSYFIRGDYIAAVQAKTQSETISKVLYPPDDTGSGKELRLKQQYFFVSATLQDILRRYRSERRTFADFSNKVQIQLNDTHPAVAIPELMRLLMDEHRLEWDDAWRIVTSTFAYTNHTVLPEALESWSEELFGRLLPRQLDIVREIDRRFRERLERTVRGDTRMVERMAILSGGQIRMANLAIVGSHTVNGVAKLHTHLLHTEIFRDFHELWPDRIISVTNGVTQRRWLLKSNPALSELIGSRIGTGWVTDLEQLSGLEPHAADAVFQEWWHAVKADNKVLLARVVERETGVRLNPNAMFDVQVKRMHEYKRQLLNALHVAELYLRLRDDPDLDMVPRAVIFGGKAAPTYWTAKLIIKLINCLADTINQDPRISRSLQVVFISDFRVTLAERIYPGSDLSEQISTAGYEASGTGNMKFALNGALTIGTLDGANIEIADAVGAENIFIFGLTAEEVAASKAKGYHPLRFYEADERIRRVLELIAGSELCPDEPGIFGPLVDALLHDDPYMHLADFGPYLDTQAEADRVYRDRGEWTRRAILNVARCGYFSSDRSVSEYAERIWRL